MSSSEPFRVRKDHYFLLSCKSVKSFASQPNTQAHWERGTAGGMRLSPIFTTYLLEDQERPPWHWTCSFRAGTRNKGAVTNPTLQLATAETPNNRDPGA